MGMATSANSRNVIKKLNRDRINIKQEKKKYRKKIPASTVKQVTTEKPTDVVYSDTAGYFFCETQNLITNVDNCKQYRKANIKEERHFCKVKCSQCQIDLDKQKTVSLKDLDQLRSNFKQ